MGNCWSLEQRRVEEGLTQGGVERQLLRVARLLSFFQQSCLPEGQWSDGWNGISPDLRMVLISDGRIEGRPTEVQSAFSN